jgi:hypothetical protein
MEIKMNNRNLHYLVILFLSMMMAVSYHFSMAAEHITRVTAHASMHNDIIMHTAPSPYRYRLLAPYIAEVISRLSPYPISEGRLLIAYSILHFMVIPAAMLLLYLWVSKTTSNTGGLIAAVILFLYWPVVLVGVYHWYTIWALIEILLLSLGLLTQNRPRLFALILILAVLNRETGGVLALVYFVNHPKRLSSYVFLGLAVAIVIGLRLSLGFAAHESSAGESFNSLLSQTIIFNLFFIPLWIAAGKGYSHVSSDLQRYMLVVAIYAVFLLLFASLREIRLYLTIFPLLLPMAVELIQSKVQIRLI